MYCTTPLQRKNKTNNSNHENYRDVIVRLVFMIVYRMLGLNIPRVPERSNSERHALELVEGDLVCAGGLKKIRMARTATAPRGRLI